MTSNEVKSYIDYLNGLLLGNGLDAAYLEFMPKQGEVVYCHAFVTLEEPRGIRRTTSYRSTYNSPGWSESKTDYEFQQIDIGIVYVTNYRFLFIGERLQRNHRHQEILSFDYDWKPRRGFLIRVENRQRAMRFKGRFMVSDIAEVALVMKAVREPDFRNYLLSGPRKEVAKWLEKHNVFPYGREPLRHMICRLFKLLFKGVGCLVISLVVLICLFCGESTNRQDQISSANRIEESSSREVEEEANMDKNNSCQSVSEFQLAETGFTAENRYKRDAERGDAEAQFNLACRYNKGDGVARDVKLALKLLHKAAENGHAKAQFCLACCYRDGEGVSRNKSKAFKWLVKSAEQGYSYAQYNLGLFYYNGDGIEQDRSEAMRWFRKAAEQGHAKAQDALRKLGQ